MSLRDIRIVVVGAVVIVAILAWMVTTVARLPYTLGHYRATTECYGCMAPPAHEQR